VKAVTSIRVPLLAAALWGLALGACAPGSEGPGGESPGSAEVVIQYDCIPNYANWGAVTALYEETTGVRVPPDMKGSSAAMAALEAEKANPQADTAYYSGAIGYEAARRGLHQPYKPAGWEAIPEDLKDPQGLWWTVHTGTIALIVNTAALEGRPVPTSWEDLLDPGYEGLVAYDDPTWGGTAYTFVYGINRLLGGSADDFEPGLGYLVRLDANIHSYPRESVYNDVLRGEIPIWINADGNGYKMKWVDGGPVEVVIPQEGTFSMPLVMGLVAGAPRPRAARRYLDWLLTPPAQAELARAYFRPVVPGATPPEIAERFLPASEYARVRNLDLAEMAAASDALKRAWLERIRGGGSGG
jgi:putative spermidine/putrescine transport system substrate-binding protein